MDTTNKYIGNTLANMTEEDLHEVFEQYAKKTSLGKENILDYFKDIMTCERFDNMGNALSSDEIEEIEEAGR